MRTQLVSIEFFTWFLSGGGILLGLCTGLLILLVKNNYRKSNFIFGCILILGSLAILSDLMDTTQIYFPFLERIPLYYSLSFGLFIYLYIYSRSDEEFSLINIDWGHFFLPVLQCAIYWLIGFPGMELSSNAFFFDFLQTYFLIEKILFPLTLIFYILLSYKFLIKRKEQLELKDESLYQWTKRFLDITTILCFLEIFYLGIALVIPRLIEALAPSFAYLRLIVGLTYVYWIAFKGYEHISVEASIYSKELPLPSKEETKKDKRPLMHAAHQAQIQKITQLLAINNLYRDSNLSVTKLAKHLNVSPKKTSAIINQEMQTKFNDLVNGYRIREVKTRLEQGDHQQQTILSIAKQAGFESQSTFYRSFKQETGHTPSQYLKYIERANKHFTHLETINNSSSAES